MQLVEGIVIIICFLAINAFYAVFLWSMHEKNEMLIKYLMVTKDSQAYNNIQKGKPRNKEEEKEKIKENKDKEDYQELIKRGICNEEDIKRFGIADVSQG